MSHAVRLCTLALVLGAFLGCGDDDNGTNPRETFVATLDAAGERAAGNDVTSDATGTATFTVNGSQIDYVLDVQNIRNVFAAHIHTGTATENGPVLIPLFAATPPTGEVNGELTRGTLTLPTGTTVDQLKTQMAGGGLYVNVHTNDGADPPNTGAGDFPAGEIRGQIGPQ
jgi:hypothetical protein